MAQKASNNKPATEYHSAGIPDGPTVWLAGFGKRTSGYRNGANQQEITPTMGPFYERDSMPVFRIKGDNDEEGSL